MEDEFLDALEEYGLIISETDEGLILGLSTDKLRELMKLAEEDGNVIVLIKSKSDDVDYKN